MSRLGRRNKTRWIKLMKKRGFEYFKGKLYKLFGWSVEVIA